MTRQSHTFRNPRKRTTRNPLDLRTFAAMTRQSHTFRNPRKRTPRFAYVRGHDIPFGPLDLRTFAAMTYLSDPLDLRTFAASLYLWKCR